MPGDGHTPTVVTPAEHKEEVKTENKNTQGQRMWLSLCILLFLPSSGGRGGTMPKEASKGPAHTPADKSKPK